MFKKICNIIFVVAFLVIITLPLIFMNRSSGGVSEDENRNLAVKPNLLVDGKFNEKYTTEYEAWFRDHLGFRQKLINLNASMQFNVFGRMLDKSNYYIGRNGDLIYADAGMIYSYTHLDLRSEDKVKEIGDSYQILSDYFEAKGMQFYYVQCYDKHSIYPEQFMASVNQVGDISKTDQIITYVENNTSVRVISLKDELIDNKAKYEVYSNWGDATHWTDRGAYIGYKYIMSQINKYNDNKFSILDEEDYNITISDKGTTLNGVIHKVDMLESFVIKEPKAERVDKAIMGKWGEDYRHSAWRNENAGNDTKVLLMCDSYVANYIVEDFAESFGEVWLVWTEYTEELFEVVELYQPDIIIYEHVERVDRSGTIRDFVKKFNAQ